MMLKFLNLFAMSVNILWLPFIIMFSGFTGFFFRSYQISKSKKRIIKLENEMLNDHAEILRLQQELTLFKKESKIDSPSKTKIVTMGDPIQEDRRVTGGTEKKDL